MHESGLAKQLLDVILERLPSLESGRVRQVNGWIAETEKLNRDALAFHFAAHARGTAAEGATLELELSEVRARCENCASEYLPDHHVTLCPSCGSTEATLLGQPGLGIESMEVDE